MIELGEIDLAARSGTLDNIDGETWLLVRHGRRILGEERRRQLRPGDEDQLRQDLWWAHAAAVAAGDRIPEKVGSLTAADISIVICTKDRPQFLEGCLRAVGELKPRPGEVIVVDNASADDRSANLATRFGATVVSAPVPGLDRARNRGWRAARRPIVTYVDDDARPDAGFAEAVAAGFAHPTIGAVTGLVLPAELGTYAQAAFETREGGMRKGFNRWLMSADDVGLAAYQVGVGTNMAIRRTLLESLAGFDERLDVGTATRGGGDLDMFWRVLDAGQLIAYEPDAMVRHIHRRDRRGLVNQLRDNGIAYRAFLELRRRENPALEKEVRRAVAHWHYERHFRRFLSALRWKDLLVAQLAVSEWLGSRHGVAALDHESERVAP